MTSLFITILNMSIMASIVALAVMLVRIPLKKAPKIFSYILWGVVLFRLICPYNIITNFSLVPIPFETIPQNIVYSQNPETQAASAGSGDFPANPEINSVLPPVTSENINPIVPDNSPPIINAETNPESNAGTNQENTIPAELENNTNIIYTVLYVAGYAWLFGFLALMIYATIGYIRLKRRVYYATLIRDNIYETDTIKTPFVLGFFNPKIYMPVSIDPAQHDYIIKHEQTHIRRCDYIIKPLAFIMFALHWFNPLMWVAYYLMSRDIEMSCDEAVLSKADTDIRDVYSSALLNLSVKKGGLLTPLAFGESAVKGRVKNVLNFKKPSRVIIIAAIALVAVLSVGFAVNGTNGANGNSLLEFEVVFSNVTEYSRKTEFKLGDRFYSDYIVNGQVQTANIRGLKEVGYAYDDFGRYRIFEREGYSIDEFIVVQDYGFMNPATIYIAITSMPSEIEPPPNTYLPQIMHAGVMYYLDSNPQIDIEFELTENTPRIKSTVSLAQIPQENGQANFGDVDAPYVLFEDGLFVIWNNKWTHFITLEQLTSSEQRNMTLDDVRMLAAKGDDLLFEEIQQYRGVNFSSNFDRYIMVYGVEGGYRLVVHSNPAGKPSTVYLESIWESGGSGIDIRYEDVDEFLRSHPSQEAITEDQALQILHEWSRSVPLPVLEPLGTSLEPGEACWAFNNMDVAGLGQYLAVGKRSGIIYIGQVQADGSVDWYKASSIFDTAPRVDMTLNDVRGLAAKGTAITNADLEPYRFDSPPTGLFHALYPVNNGAYTLRYTSSIEWGLFLTSAEDLANGIQGIDIRYYDVDMYIADGTREFARPSSETLLDESFSPTAIVRRKLISSGVSINYVFLLSQGSQRAPRGVDNGEIAVVYASYIDGNAIYNMRYDFERATSNSEWTHYEPTNWDGIAIDVAAHVACEYFSEQTGLNNEDIFVSWAGQEEAETLFPNIARSHFAAFYIGRSGDIPVVIILTSPDGESNWEVIGYSGVALIQ